MGSDEGRALKGEQEAQVWLCAAEHYRDFLTAIVGDAVASYRRKPGLDSLIRIYKQDMGAIPSGYMDLNVSTHGSIA